MAWLSVNRKGVGNRTLLLTRFWNMDDETILVTSEICQKKKNHMFSSYQHIADVLLNLVPAPNYWLATGVRLCRYSLRKGLTSTSGPRFKGVHFGSSLKSLVAIIYCLLLAPHPISPTSPSQASTHILAIRSKSMIDTRWQNLHQISNRPCLNTARRASQSNHPSPSISAPTHRPRCAHQRTQCRRGYTVSPRPRASARGRTT